MKASIRRDGFTLIELMVAVTILAILLALAAPGFAEFQRNSQLSAATNIFVSGLNAARTEAMKRNVAAMMVPIDGDWSKGFMAFADVNLNGTYEEATDKLLMRQELEVPYLTISGNGTTRGDSPYLRYDGSGFARTLNNSSVLNMTLNFSRNDVSGSASYRQMRRLTINVAGRLRVCTPASASDADCGAGGDN